MSKSNDFGKKKQNYYKSKDKVNDHYNLKLLNQLNVK